MSASSSRSHQLDAMQRKISNLMKQNMDTQADLLKVYGTYREAVENLAQASDGIAQHVSKMAMTIINAHNLHREYRALQGNGLSAEQDTKQKQLSAALQQIVKFHTVMSVHQQMVANTVLRDFDRPISVNLDKYRDVAAVITVFCMS
jgi:hypothetical protein